jgi:predicted porin
MLLLFYPITAYTQSGKDSIEIYFRPYAGLRGHLAVYDRELEVQENASRIGVEFNIKKDRLTFIVGTEVQINMFKDGHSFNTDGNLSGGFLTVQSEQKQQVFANRLGYLGLSFDKYGLFTIGKQWSVYYDVTLYTDRFSVFGGRASATFIGGTDGGASGTGRADQSIIYRNQIGPLYFGVQVQARGANNNRFIDGFGASVQVEIQKDFFIGTAYNRAFLSKDLLNSGTILGLSGYPTYFSLGTKYVGEKIDFSIVGSLQQNGDFTQGYYFDSESGAMTPSVVFNAKGLEVFGKYKLQKIAFLVGYNLYLPDIDAISTVSGQHPLDPGFRKNDVIAGVVYQPVRFVQIYGEQRVSLGKNALGNKEQSVFAIGMKVELSKQYKEQIKF